MTVHIVADTDAKLAALRTMLQKQYGVTSELLSSGSRQCSGADAVVVTANLRVVENIAALKEVFGKITHIRKRIFLIDEKARLFTVQAYALGATLVLVNPVDQA